MGTNNSQAGIMLVFVVLVFSVLGFMVMQVGSDEPIVAASSFRFAIVGPECEDFSRVVYRDEEGVVRELGVGIPYQFRSTGFATDAVIEGHMYHPMMIEFIINEKRYMGYFKMGHTTRECIKT